MKNTNAKTFHTDPEKNLALNRNQFLCINSRLCSNQFKIKNFYFKIKTIETRNKYHHKNKVMIFSTMEIFF